MNSSCVASGSRNGLSQAGLPGAVAAWTAFTMSSAIALILFGFGVIEFGDAVGFGAVRNALLGVNAAVVGLLLAALYDPVWTSAILSPADFGLAVGRCMQG